MVYLEDGTKRKMSDLAIGDRVFTVDASGALAPSPVYLMPHAIPSGRFHFKRIVMSSNHTLTMTPDHYMLVADVGLGSHTVHRRAVPAGQVKVGDRVWVMADGKGLSLTESTVTDVRDIFEEGLFAPFTLTGTIVVDGVVASVYTTMFGPEWTMHAFCGWVRAVWKTFPQLFIFLHSVGLASPISMGIAHLTKAVLGVFSRA